MVIYSPFLLQGSVQTLYLLGLSFHPISRYYWYRELLSWMWYHVGFSTYDTVTYRGKLLYYLGHIKLRCCV
jgi:hypothetical protein